MNTGGELGAFSGTGYGGGGGVGTRMSNVRNLSEFMVTVPKGPFWLSTPCHTICDPAVGPEAAKTTWVSF